MARESSIQTTLLVFVLATLSSGCAISLAVFVLSAWLGNSGPRLE